jgi:hypothetical protein
VALMMRVLRGGLAPQLVHVQLQQVCDQRSTDQACLQSPIASIGALPIALILCYEGSWCQAPAPAQVRPSVQRGHAYAFDCSSFAIQMLPYPLVFAVRCLHSMVCKAAANMHQRALLCFVRSCHVQVVQSVSEMPFAHMPRAVHAAVTLLLNMSCHQSARMQMIQV